MESPNKHRAFEEGRAAYHDGKTEADNPYPASFDEYRFWRNGFDFKPEATQMIEEAPPVTLTDHDKQAIAEYEEALARLTPQERAAIENEQ